MKRYKWLSDLHMNTSLLPALKRFLLRNAGEGDPDGLFITGDISSGRWIESDLRFLAKHFSGPIYFVLGNHDLHGRHIESVHSDVRRVSREHPNLRWMRDEGVIPLSQDVALIGADGWYDARHGDPRHLRWTPDWFLVHDALHLPSHAARVEEWRRLARASAEALEARLTAALDGGYTTVYVLTHVPPWKEATRAVGTLMESFWLPYNTNAAAGEAIERVMAGRNKKRCVVLAGHTHTPCTIRVTRNIECSVAPPSYTGRASLIVVR
jgi:predicted phosphohydrolase